MGSSSRCTTRTHTYTHTTGMVHLPTREEARFLAEQRKWLCLDSGGFTGLPPVRTTCGLPTRGCDSPHTGHGCGRTAVPDVPLPGPAALTVTIATVTRITTYPTHLPYPCPTPPTLPTRDYPITPHPYDYTRLTRDARSPPFPCPTTPFYYSLYPYPSAYGSATHCCACLYTVSVPNTV